MRSTRFMFGLVAAVALTVAPAVIAQSGADTEAKASAAGWAIDSFDGYDFGQVVEAMETSVNPLQREMDHSFRLFVDGVREADRLLDEGRTQDAVEMAGAAINAVLAVRETVLVPMWNGQEALAEQIANVRARLARAVKSAEEYGPEALDQQTEATLNAIARRISAEKDSLRTKRLVAHYRTVRNIARIRVMAVQLSPDQRKMWLSVLQVLDEAAIAHQQVMLGTEVLFAQFEATSANLQAYVSLIETVDGASQLIRIVRGVDEHSAGMATFAASMGELQRRLTNFNESVEQALQGRMLELEAQVDLINPMMAGLSSRPTVPGDEDAELAARMARLSGEIQ